MGSNPAAPTTPDSKTTLAGLTGADLRSRQNAELEASGLTRAEIAAVRVAERCAAAHVMHVHTAIRTAAGHAAARLLIRHLCELLEAVNGCECGGCARGGRPS